MLLQNEHTDGLIASSEPYSSLLLPWGSNPITDRLMSSDSFSIVHDAAAVTRNQKVRAISTWKEATRSIRVCWQGEHMDRNCGRCEKCIRTILNFRVMGLGLKVSKATLSGVAFELTFFPLIKSQSDILESD